MALWLFMCRVVGGALAFAVVAGVAALLRLLVHVICGTETTSMHYYVLTGGEYLLLWVDAVCLVVFLWRELVKFLWGSPREHHA